MHPGDHQMSDPLIGADMPLDAQRFPIRELLDAFRGASLHRSGLRLALTGRRSSTDEFLVWNYLDEHGLVAQVDFLPHYGQCTDFPAKKQDCAFWVGRDTPAAELTAEALLRQLENGGAGRDNVALFVTSFHPAKHEGNSALMRQWLEHLRFAGYRVHVVYYAIDRRDVSEAMRMQMRSDYDLVVEVEVKTASVNRNRSGLNVHVDDWCGVEVLDAVSELTAEFAYDIAVVNYAFMSAVFDRVAAYTRKILLTHDSFADRNRRMLMQGFSEAGWVSLDQRGEAQAFRRADVVIALQDGEASEFRRLAGPCVDVRVIGPLQTGPKARRPSPGPKLRIGYFGSGNYVNEFSLTAYLTELAKQPDVVAGTQVVVAGRVSLTLPHFASAELLARLSPRLLGPVDLLYEFFEQCDVCINPELGGTGVKIKTLDVMAHGVPVLTTAAGAAGINSVSRFHAADNIAGLVQLTAELMVDRGLVESARRDAIDTYAAYVARHANAMTELLGPPIHSLSVPTRGEVPQQTREMVIPEFVGRVAAPYHLEEFGKVFSRVDLRGKHVLEIGSDFNLACARLLAANGAAEVVANNLWEWRCSEPLPPNIRFCVGNICDVNLPEHYFDIIFGIAILEHVEDPVRVAQAAKRVLRPDGIAYLQGSPLWTSSLGHHVWVDKHQISQAEGTVCEAANDVVYSFADPTKNPIPNWAHLTHSPEELGAILVERQLPAAHAASIVRFVYNTDGTMTGSCSNFKTPSEILAAFREHFAVEVEPMLHRDPEHPEFRKALDRYSETDLSTNGLGLWLTHKNRPPVEWMREAPVVSVIIPFYNVEDYIADCLASVLAQDLTAVEVILVDDQSRDGSRAIANRVAAEDRRIRIVTHAENHGLGIARNTGVRHARGDYVFFLDSDDLMSGPDVLRRLVDAAQEIGCRVVIGSSAWLMPDGTIDDFDRRRDRESDGHPGSVQDGLDAFLGGLSVPGYRYLPLRAWGTLIHRAYYEELSLDYPPGEHEDIPHTPFLYYLAGGVYYDRHVAVLYRQRLGGLSSTRWSAAKFRRYAGQWQEMKLRMHAYGLRDQVGDAAAMFADHLMWKIEISGITVDAGEVAAEVLQSILSDLAGARSRQFLFHILENLPKQPWNATRDLRYFESMTEGMPWWALMQFHQEKLGLGQAASDAGPSDEAATSGAVALRAPRPIEANAAREAEIFAGYEEAASDCLKTFPAMLTYGDRALYFHAARNFTFRGSIVDGGCFVGGSTLSLVEGLSRNALVRSGRANTRGLIRVYDRFMVDEDYILHHLKENYPERDFLLGSSFQSLFEKNLQAERELLQVRPGDVTAIGYGDAEPIELFCVDFCKALPITDFVVRTFFPRLLLGALVLQQDFVHEYHPHIHLSMLRLAGYFETYVELRWGGTVAYTCIKPITPAIVRERFGTDSSWFADTVTNIMLLRRLIEESHYDENRWVFLLVLGMYHLAQNRPVEARAAYREARERFPQFVPNHLTRQMIGD
jgi:glycosyltransferase involved in cell wall biosynthesis/SAM-dependent methyltransferase